MSEDEAIKAEYAQIMWSLVRGFEDLIPDSAKCTAACERFVKAKHFLLTNEVTVDEKIYEGIF